MKKLMMMVVSVAGLALLGTSSLEAQTVTATWAPGTGNTGTVVYNLFRGDGNCGAAGQVFAKRNAAVITGTTTTDTGMTPGANYCFYVTGLRPDGTLESVPSNKVTASIPLNAPSNFQITLNLTAEVKVEMNGVQVAQANATKTAVVPTQGN